MQSLSQHFVAHPFQEESAFALALAFFFIFLFIWIFLLKCLSFLIGLFIVKFMASLATLDLTLNNVLTSLNKKRCMFGQFPINKKFPNMFVQ